MGDIIHQGGQYSPVNIVLGGQYSLVNNVRGDNFWGGQYSLLHQHYAQMPIMLKIMLKIMLAQPYSAYICNIATLTVQMHSWAKSAHSYMNKECPIASALQLGTM